MTSDSNSKRIVVTGCSRGLGRALVDEFIKAGHKVAGCSRSADQMTMLAATYGEENQFHALDVSDELAVAHWARQLITTFGAPDLLINNAALICQPAPLWQVPVAEFQQMVNVNIVGVQLVIRHVLPAMIDRAQGVVVNLSSDWGRSVSAGVAPYCASKWAIEGLTKALAEELPQGMAAVPLSPGVIDTQMLRIAFGDTAQDYHGPAEWAAKAAPYMLSLNASHNGQSLSTPE